MRYSPDRKEAVVRKMMPPHNRSIKELAQEEGISEATLLKGSEYRYLAVREPMEDQLILPGMEEYKRDLPFQSMVRDKTRHKVFGIVTNMDWDGQELIEWHYKRCGRSEEAHSVMKEDLGGGTLPSGDFGENAAWWWIMILAFNLNAALKSLVLGGKWVHKRMKAMRVYPARRKPRL